MIIEESYYKKLNEIVNDNNLGYNKIGLVKGFNPSKGDWVEVFILNYNKFIIIINSFVH